MSSCCQSTGESKCRRFSPFGLLFKVAVVYVALVFSGGMLINSGNPVAIEVGRMMQLVTAVEPTIHWADSHGHQRIAGAMRAISGSADIAH